MIPILVDFYECRYPTFSIRGNNYIYWLNKFYAPYPVYGIDEFPADSPSFIIYNACYFPDQPLRYLGLQHFLEQAQRYGSDVIQLGESPFISVSQSFFQRHRQEFRPGIFHHLAEREAEHMPVDEEFTSAFIPTRPAEVEKAVVSFQIARLLENNVFIQDFNHFYLDSEIPVGGGARIGANVVVCGKSSIGSGTTIYPNCYLENAVIGRNCTILPGSIVRDSVIGDQVQLGPYCHIREHSQVQSGARIGNFVEMKKSAFGEGSKAMHLSYIGDATVGRRVNVGAGTITCNYDGVRKNPTHIEDDVFIGSGTELVAPVTLRRGSYVGAGSTITEDVPEDSLGLARARQRNLLNWALKRREKTGS